MTATRLWLTAVVALLAVGAAFAAEDVAPEVAAHEKALRDAKIGTDPASLVEVFRSRTLSDADRAKIGDLVRQLGHRSFTQREQAERDLIKLGKSALPKLQEALTDSDKEISRRATRCIDAIQSGGDTTLVISAAALVGLKAPKGATEALLAYLPSAADRLLVESVHAALVKIALKDGKVSEVIVKTLEDKEPRRRAAAAHVVARGDEKQREVLKPLLADTDPEVRYQAAAGLLRSGNSDAVEGVLGLLTNTPLDVAVQAEELLCRLAGGQSPSVTLGDSDASRGKCQDAWKGWWKNNAAKVDFKALTLEDAYLGLTIICEAQMKNSRGRVWECGTDGKPRWQIECNNPLDVQLLPGERLLIAEYGGGRVMETDRNGKVLWEYKIDSPVAAQRLPGGNTFIANYSRILEVTRDGKVVYNWQRQGSVYHAFKRRDGHVLSCHSNGEVFELDSNGKAVTSLNVGGFSKWAGIEVLPSGNWLVAKAGADEVVEIDRTGKVLWRVAAKNPNAATRLRNGHTLVSSHDDQTVYEFDSQGREVWKQKMEGRPFRARRR